MRKLLLLALIASCVCDQPLHAAPSAGTAKHYTACTLMTLKDAKSLIGADAALQPESTTDNHCYYRSNGGAAYLHVSDTSGHLWLDYKAAGKQVKGVGDEAYFYPANTGLGNTLMVRKGDVAIVINARSDSLSDEAIQKHELDFSRAMTPRL